MDKALLLEAFSSVVRVALAGGVSRRDLLDLLYSQSTQTTPDQDIGRLGFSPRLERALRRAGITTLAELTETTQIGLFMTEGIGQTYVTQIERKLASRGLRLKGG